MIDQESVIKIAVKTVSKLNAFTLLNFEKSQNENIKNPSSTYEKSSRE